MGKPGKPAVKPWVLRKNIWREGAAKLRLGMNVKPIGVQEIKVYTVVGSWVPPPGILKEKGFEGVLKEKTTPNNVHRSSFVR
jgi:hypothetical protein